jgi:hypothetical protein
VSKHGDRHYASGSLGQGPKEKARTSWLLEERRDGDR